MFGLHIVHSARREVGSADGIADEGQEDGVFGSATAHLLEAEDALVGDEVGVFILEASRRECSVEIDDNLILGGLLDYALEEVDHPLVGMIHEVDLYGRDAPFGVGLEQCVEVLFYCEPRQPEHNLHALGVAVLDEVGQAQVVVAVEGIAR